MRKTSIVTVLVAVALAVPLSVYASHQFTDVPNSNTFHNSIDWMKDNGITVGCNPPANTRYCPNDNVTRGQMAAFMKRLAENQVVDAASVGGLNAAGLGARAAFSSSNDVPDTQGTILTANIVAPARGLLVINADVQAAGTGALPVVSCFLNVDEVALQGTFMVTSLGSPAFGGCGASSAVAVDPGPHTVSFNANPQNANLLSGSLTAIWVPFDGTGATP